MKIFAVNGSPNMKKGMTHILLEIFLEGAREAGAEVKTVFLQKKKINYCLGCFNCWVKTPGVCVHKDDMPELAEEIDIDTDFIKDISFRKGLSPDVEIHFRLKSAIASALPEKPNR